MSSKNPHLFHPRLAWGWALLAAASGAAGAADRPWSFQAAIGAGPTRIDVRCEASSADCDRKSIAKLLSFAAVHESHWGVELAYENGGKYLGSQIALLPFSGRAEISSASLAALYLFGPERIPMQVRLGVARTRTEFTYVTGASGEVTLDTWQPLAGFALDIRLSKHLALRWDLHATRARIANDPSVIGVTTLGLAAHF
jgi:hypothetical protein